MDPRRGQNALAIGLVAAAATAAGVAVAVLGHVPFAQLDHRENVAVIAVAGLVIVVSGWIVFWALLRRSA